MEYSSELPESLKVSGGGRVPDYSVSIMLAWQLEIPAQAQLDEIVIAETV
jgi:hypothetical protein